MKNAIAVRRAFVGGALVTSLCLAGCQKEATISVSQVNGVTQFTVKQTDGQPACVDKIHVTDNADAATMWSVSRTTKAAQNDQCEHLFRFGAAPQNYEMLGQVKPLTPGNRYTVSISGNGYAGKGTAFTAMK